MYRINGIFSSPPVLLLRSTFKPCSNEAMLKLCSHEVELKLFFHIKTPNGKLQWKNHPISTHRLISQCLFWLLIDINWFRSANEEMLIVSLECVLELILNGNTKIDWKSYGGFEPNAFPQGFDCRNSNRGKFTNS